MVRTRKEERRKDANKFYQLFCNSAPCRAVIVVERNVSTTNPYVNRTQFVVAMAEQGREEAVIAESPSLGVEGCWIEFFDFIHGGKQEKMFHDGDDFKDWLRRTTGIRITYYDGKAFIIERL